MDYKSSRWREKRKTILRRDKCRCRECSRFGSLTDASVVHHAYPAEDYPQYAWCDWNLISLCVGCHNAMHDRETGALTEKGLAWLRRVSPPFQENSSLSKTTGRERNLSDGEINGGGGNSNRARIRACIAHANDAGA